MTIRPFVLQCECPTCGLDAPHNVAACQHTATEVPLRCVHAADPAEIANWPVELFHKGGQVYRPVTKVVKVPDVRIVRKEKVIPEGEPVPPFGAFEDVEEPYERDEKVLDEAATLAAGPAIPPRTLKHVHRTCVRCGETWAESKE